MKLQAATPMDMSMWDGAATTLMTCFIGVLLLPAPFQEVRTPTEA